MFIMTFILCDVQVQNYSLSVNSRYPQLKLYFQDSIPKKVPRELIRNKIFPEIFSFEILATILHKISVDRSLKT